MTIIQQNRHLLQWIRRWHLLLLLLTGCCTATAQTKDSIATVDVGDILHMIFKKKDGIPKAKKKPGAVILPSLGYNPSFGFIIGGKLSGSRQSGNPRNTGLSVFGLEFLYGTREITMLKARHNVLTKENRWNLQGDWQVSKFGMVDYGLGTGNSAYRSNSFGIDIFPITNADSAFPIKYIYIKLSEKVYRSIAPHWFAGAGLWFDIYTNIDDVKAEDGQYTPHKVYSLYKDFDLKKYSMNGLLLAVQYNTREHPIRSYGGIYADVSARFNQRWLGSTKNSIQLMTDFRKYWSLSRRNPEHVLAIWNWAVYTLSGDLPYLALPYTADDTYNRMGRAYTLGRFKGPSYCYFETEWRYPITRNKLISGVVFLNLQTASDGLQRKLFEYWEPGAGVGLRILFQKQTRSTMCADIARGRYGASGIFFGLNEVF